MLPLLFIMLVTSISVLVSYHASEEVTWFTYYLGGVAGLFISGVFLHYWNKHHKQE